jgi:hypothetical protein
MARAGDDARLAQMLLEVAVDLEAEAEAIEAEETQAKPLAVNPPEPALTWLWGLQRPARELNPVTSAPATETVT